MPETIDVQSNGAVLRVTLNRPDVHNAMSNQMVEELIAVFEAVRGDRGTRAIVIGAEGKTFCSGGDIRDLQADAAMSHDERVQIMTRFDVMLRTINEAPQVTIARVQGPALGGGFGLVCVSDIAIAGDRARFGLPEVRLGVSPALISPYVIARIGLSRTRRLMLTGGHLDADEALDAGLVHQTCTTEDLDVQINAILDDVLQCAPNALAETKKLIFHVAASSLEESLPYRADLISRLRYSEEGQEGMTAFIQKRKPAWAESGSEADDKTE